MEYEVGDGRSKKAEDQYGALGRDVELEPLNTRGVQLFGCQGEREVSDSGLEEDCGLRQLVSGVYNKSWLCHSEFNPALHSTACRESGTGLAVHRREIWITNYSRKKLAC